MGFSDPRFNADTLKRPKNLHQSSSKHMQRSTTTLEKKHKATYCISTPKAEKKMLMQPC